MANRRTQETWVYNQALSRALKIVKEKGVPALEAEVTARGIYDIPLNVSPDELTELTRLRMHDELMCVSTALATALTDGLSLPPSYITEFLIVFNDLVDVYRADPEALKKAMDALEMYPGFEKITQKYNEYKEMRKND